MNLSLVETYIYMLMVVVLFTAPITIALLALSLQFIIQGEAEKRLLQ